MNKFSANEKILFIILPLALALIYAVIVENIRAYEKDFWLANNRAQHIVTTPSVAAPTKSATSAAQKKKVSKIEQELLRKGIKPKTAKFWKALK